MQKLSNTQEEFSNMKQEMCNMSKTCETWVIMQEARSKCASMDPKMNMDLSMEHPNMASQDDGSRNKSK